MNKLSFFIALAAFLLFISCQKEEMETMVSPAIRPDSSAAPVEEAFPGEVGRVEKGTLFGTPIEYAMINGQAVFQGDILLSPGQLAGQPSDNKNARTEAAGRSNLATRWPNNTVYYTIGEEVNSYTRSDIAEAIAHWETHTPVRFVARTSQRNYVNFKATSAGCSSYIGMIGGEQYIQVGICNIGTIIHEIGHAVGLWHEQSRADRDEHITIHWENIRPGYAHNFQTFIERGKDGFDYGPFDFGSIMMYHPWSFSGIWLDYASYFSPTITKKDGSLYDFQETGLSAGDKSIVNLMYFTWKTIPVPWRTMPGLARDISVGADGSVYVIGAASGYRGYQIFKWNGSGWTSLPVKAVRIAVSPQGVPWIVSSLGEIFRLEKDGKWHRMPGLAKDIAIGADGSVYVLGVKEVSGGYEIFKWNGNDWTYLPGGALRIAVSPDGLPTIITRRFEIFSGNLRGSWSKLQGSAVDVAFDAEGSMYILGSDYKAGTDGMAEGYGIYKKNGNDWYPLPGTAHALSAGPQGTLWMLGSDMSVFKGVSLHLK